MKVRPVDTEEQIRTKIDQAIKSWPRDASLARPYLEILLGVRPSGIEAERLASLEPDQLRQQVFVSLRRLFQILGKQRPMVLLLDDLHWIDPMSADLLLFLMTMVVSVPILFVCAQRRQGADLPNDRLVKVQSLIPDQTLHLHLPRLSLDDSAELLNELLPQTRLSPDIRQTILKQSDGNPYFIEEYIRMLIAQQVLQHSEDGWNRGGRPGYYTTACAFFVGSPRSFRIDILPPELKQLLQEASVLSAPFEMDLLERISEVRDVRVGLERLESRLLIKQVAESGQWEFSHSLIGNVAYTSMLQVRQKLLHLRIAEVLEHQYAGNVMDYAEILAYHFSNTDHSAKAVTYLVLAGEKAVNRFANEEAISLF